MKQETLEELVQTLKKLELLLRESDPDTIREAITLLSGELPIEPPDLLPDMPPEARHIGAIGQVLAVVYTDIVRDLACRSAKSAKCGLEPLLTQLVAMSIFSATCEAILKLALSDIAVTYVHLLEKKSHDSINVILELAVKVAQLIVKNRKVLSDVADLVDIMYKACVGKKSNNT